MNYKESKNYKQFNFLPFNRDYEVRNSLIKSFNKYGWLTPIVCIKSNIYGSEKLYILDGQHRFATAKFLQLPINYIVIDSKDADSAEGLVKLTAILNSSSKQWVLGDYISAYASLNLEDYIYLEKIYGETNMSYNVISQLYIGLSVSHGFNSMPIKEGLFKITKKSQGDELVSYIKSLNNIVKFSARMTIGFSGFCTSLMGKYDHNKFEDNLKKSLPMLEDITEVVSFRAVFEKIYFNK